MLSDPHLRMLRDESGIAEEIIFERGYRSIDGANGYTELKALGFSKAQALTPGLLLPLWTTDGQQALMIYRPDTPRLSKDYKPIKYEIPRGAGVRLDCPPRCQALLTDPAVPLWLTEGQKKADSLASQGAVALCLLGVWSFVGKNTFGGNTLLADFDCVAWNGRDVRLVFDSDVTSKPSVRKALERLSAHLINKKAAVRMVYLPPVDGKKVGVDDYLVAGHTLQDLEALIEAPRPTPQPAPSQIEVLDTAPACIRRPLALIDGRTYAAIWPYVRVTITETLDKQGNVMRLATPQVITEQRLFVVRDDGVVFGDGGRKPFADLGIDVHLPEIPQQAKLWTAPNVKAYVAGTRPDPGATFQQVVSVVQTFIDFNRSLGSQQTMCELVACYILATWFLDAFPVIGYLWPNGERGSGKTQLLTVVAELAYLGQVILAGGSYASLRDLADYGATLCFDDAENVMDLKRGDPDKRALLLAGNRRGNTIPVKEPVNGREWRTRHVQTFCPRLFSAIRLPDPVLASRTIILPLIRTANRDKANADPLDYRLWPIPREQLVNALWALGLAHGARLPSYDAQVVTTTTLLGRNLEPWRAILAVAHWLTDCGVDGLVARMHALSVAYQKERLDLDESDLLPLVIEALCDFGINPTPINPINPINPISVGSLDDAEIQFSTEDITGLVKTLAQDKEIGAEADKITTRRVGRLFRGIRLEEVPRPSGKRQPGAPKPSRARRWKTTKRNLRACLMAYHMDIPPEYAELPPSPPQTQNSTLSSLSSSSPLPSILNGGNGINGVNGGGGASPTFLAFTATELWCRTCQRSQPFRTITALDGTEVLVCIGCDTDLGTSVISPPPASVPIASPPSDASPAPPMADPGGTQACPQCGQPLRLAVGGKGVYCTGCRYRAVVS